MKKKLEDAGAKVNLKMLVENPPHVREGDFFISFRELGRSSWKMLEPFTRKSFCFRINRHIAEVVESL